MRNSVKKKIYQEVRKLYKANLDELMKEVCSLPFMKRLKLCKGIMLKKYKDGFKETL